MADVIRVLLVDDDPLVRAGLAMIIASASDLLVVGQAGDGLQAIDSVRTHRPQVVLMDIRMPHLDGVAATARLRAMPTPPEILVLTTFHADAYILDALRAGASGFLLKDTPPELLLAGIRTVAAGEALLAPSVTRRLIRDFVNRPTADPRALPALLDPLTAREKEMLIHVASGHSNTEIAAQLNISVATVKTHVSRLLTKLHAHDRAQLVVIAYETGLIQPSPRATKQPPLAHPRTAAGPE
jgi:DNA-binding NarL/FixJ family response regulator